MCSMTLYTCTCMYVFPQWQESEIHICMYPPCSYLSSLRVEEGAVHTVLCHVQYMGGVIVCIVLTVSQGCMFYLVSSSLTCKAAFSSSQSKF